MYGEQLERDHPAYDPLYGRYVSSKKVAFTVLKYHSTYIVVLGTVVLYIM